MIAPPLPPSKHKHVFQKRFLGYFGEAKTMTIAEAEAKRGWRAFFKRGRDA